MCKGLKTITFLSAALLTGCASHFEKEWQCPGEKGFGCQSIKNIRSVIERGDRAPIAAQEQHLKGFVPLENIQGRPDYKPDQVMRIYFSGYIDDHDNYHAPSEVYAVMRQGGWVTDDKIVHNGAE